MTGAPVTKDFERCKNVLKTVVHKHRLWQEPTHLNCFGKLTL